MEMNSERDAYAEITDNAKEQNVDSQLLVSHTSLFVFIGGLSLLSYIASDMYLPAFSTGDERAVCDRGISGLYL